MLGVSALTPSSVVLKTTHVLTTYLNRLLKSYTREIYRLLKIKGRRNRLEAPSNLKGLKPKKTKVKAANVDYLSN